MIQRIYIQNYKSLKKTEVVFPSPLTVIIGPNAAGKSNLFDAIQLVSRIVTSRNLKEAFSGHRGLPIECVHYSKGNATSLDEKEWQGMEFEIDVRLTQRVIEETERLIHNLRTDLGDASKGESKDDSPKKRITNHLLRYNIQIEVSSRTGQARIKNERLVALRQDDNSEKARGAFIEKNDKDRLSLRMEGQSRPTYHDLGLDSAVVASELYAPHYPHITAFKEEMRRCHFYYFEPRELMRAGNAIADVTQIGPRGEDLAAFYYTLQERNKPQFTNLKRNAASILPRLSNLTLDKRKSGEIFIETHEGEASYSNRLISEGTLRVLGLLAVLAPSSGSTTIGYEEPENGVHPRRISQIADLLKNGASEDRQILVNTHSAVLAGYFENQNLMVCRRNEASTCFTPFASSGSLFNRSEIQNNLEEQIVRGDYGG
jgi:predicted ATPase